MSPSLAMSRVRFPVLVMLLFAGCRGDRIKTVPVSGEIYVDGKPAENASIFLIPRAGLPDGAPRPFGQTDSEGKFILSTYKEKDGAPPGEYVAIFQWPDTSGGLFNRGSMDGADRLRGAYYDKDKSNHPVTVGKQPTAIPRFELKSPK
jgi:hypothetical protein